MSERITGLFIPADTSLMMYTVDGPKELAFYQKMVNGYVQAIYPWSPGNGIMAWLHEEELLKQHPVVNSRFGRMVFGTRWTGQPICGPIFMTRNDESLTDEDVGWLAALSVGRHQAVLGSYSRPASIVHKKFEDL